VLRGEMKHVTVARVTQKSPALHTFCELFGLKGLSTPARY
jgi:hypothetical protein